MNRIGLALSGGGFRATLFHLGLVRFMRDAGLLSQVTHITSVSGGSVFAAHLVLNWDLYNGSPNDFDAAASKLLSIVRMDVRNRIVARLLGVPARLSADELLTDHGYVGEGYGIPTAACLEAITLLAHQEGIFLDPVYTGKAMAGLIDHVRQGTLDPAGTVVFLHTGGTPALFAYVDQLGIDLAV